jgi:hypothetical protein
VLYGHNFYASRDASTRQAADVVLGIICKKLTVRSAVDVGCGVGTWLSALNGDVQGIDGPWVDTTLLKIARSNFLTTDLRNPIRLPKRYDLCISLEVAEHIPAACAQTFVESLTGLSDNVLFSAAIPHQGGTGHVNEQWPSYWSALFHAKGYGCQDFIRPLIWNDRRIPLWYRQNILFFQKHGPHADPLSLAHPELYRTHAAPKGVKGNAMKLWQSVLERVGL